MNEQVKNLNDKISVLLSVPQEQWDSHSIANFVISFLEFVYHVVILIGCANIALMSEMYWLFPKKLEYKQVNIE